MSKQPHLIFYWVWNLEGLVISEELYVSSNLFSPNIGIYLHHSYNTTSPNILNILKYPRIKPLFGQTTYHPRRQDITMK